jgi:hypothetical protein
MLDSEVLLGSWRPVVKLGSWVLVLIPVGAAVAAAGGCGASASAGLFAGGGATSVIIGPGGSGGSTTGVTFSTTGTPTIGQIALRCTGDTDCGGDLTCVLPGDDNPVFGGGAPGGFCTKPCSVDADCAVEGGICYRPDPTQGGTCTLACGFGPPITGVGGLFDPLMAVKCRARDDVRCIPYGTTEGACVPTCGSDSQCSLFGGHCDPRTAVCVTSPSGGDPTGSTCDPSKEVDTCAGLCVGFQTGDSMCSAPCVLGGAGIGSPACDGPTHGLCAFHPAANGPGDTGFCTPSCAFQSDCQTPNFWCFGVALLSSATGRGYCFAATPCPNGPSDCSPGDGGGPVYTCTTTPGGRFCLDTTFPLDADAGLPDAGASMGLDAGTDGEAHDAGPGPFDAGAADGGGDGGDGG